MQPEVAPPTAVQQQWQFLVAPAAQWGGDSRQTRIFKAMAASLADPSLPPLPEDVRQVMPPPTLAHLADILRMEKRGRWRAACGITNRGALAHQAALRGCGLELFSRAPTLVLAAVALVAVMAPACVFSKC